MLREICDNYADPFDDELKPFDAKLDLSISLLTEKCESLENIVEQKTWFDQFDAEATNKRIYQIKREIEPLRETKAELEQRLAISRKKVIDSSQSSRVGWNPKDWFSPLKTLEKRRYEIAKENHGVLIEEHDVIFNRLSKLEKSFKNNSSSLRRYQNFDVLSVSATISALGTEIKNLEKEIKDLQERKKSLELKLSKPYRCLEEFKKERKSVLDNIKKAQYFADKLSNASTSKERAIIHDNCRVELGESKPNLVINNLNKKLNYLDSSIKKLEVRLKKIVENTCRDIRHLVIDGNNLCYQSDHFIGLQALYALIPKLVLKYKVTLIFDPGIKFLLGMSEKELRQRFPGAEVHVVPEGKKADLTIIDVAGSDLKTFIISRDRFVDYPEKEAVEKGRLILPVIINNSIIIDELDIKLLFNDICA